MSAITSEHPNQIAERTTGGLNVQLAHLPIMDMIVLQCQVEDRVFAVSVDKANAFDAFHHPMLYLAPSQVAALFPRRTAE